MPDTKTPALINIPVVALRIAADVALYLLLPLAWVAAGLMAGSAISFVLAAAIGYWLLRRRIGPLGLRQVFTTLSRLGIAAVVGAVAAAIVLFVMVRMWGDLKVASLLELVVGGVVLLSVYGAVAFALRVHEVRELTSMVLGRFRRG